jgi:hypothetical protein
MLLCAVNSAGLLVQHLVVEADIDGGRCWVPGRLCTTRTLIELHAACSLLAMSKSVLPITSERAASAGLAVGADRAAHQLGQLAREAR